MFYIIVKEIIRILKLKFELQYHAWGRPGSIWTSPIIMPVMFVYLCVCLQMLYHHASHSVRNVSQFVWHYVGRLKANFFQIAWNGEKISRK